MPRRTNAALQAMSEENRKSNQDRTARPGYESRSLAQFTSLGQIECYENLAGFDFFAAACAVLAIWIRRY